VSPAERSDAVSPALQDSILTWYASRARSLPFRGTTDPYAILVSEAMAQQTRAARAGEAWTAFMARFPTVSALAAATPADVLRAWKGLGYNRRALNLWRAAGEIVSRFGGQVPADVAALESLPGVGRYTARAVAALAFGMPVGAVDTNVRRVLGRIVAGEVGDLSAAALQSVADAIVPPDRPGAWTHALMDIGATVCRPRRPDCAACPARSWCRYAGNSVIEARAEAVVGVPFGRSVRRARSGPGGRSVRGARSVPGAHAARGSAAARESSAPFRSTSRWLRGRILDRLREAQDGDWVNLEDPIGEHDALAVAFAAETLANEGLLQLDKAVLPRVRARLPTS
jgi:A/G-specific adenine glycosylase